MKDSEYTDGIYAILKGAARVEDEGGWGSYSYEFHTDKFESLVLHDTRCRHRRKKSG